jgi:hypothetical protein
MKTVTLNKDEMEILFQQDPSTKSEGGWQSLLVTLQECTDRTTGQCEIATTVLPRIAKYAFDYGNGGWETRLMGIFARTLGPKLGRV